MHAIGPMAVPADRGFQARRAAAPLTNHYPLTANCTALRWHSSSPWISLSLRLSLLLHPDWGTRLFVGSVAWVSRTPGLWASAGAKRRVRDSTPVFVSPEPEGAPCTARACMYGRLVWRRTCAANGSTRGMGTSGSRRQGFPLALDSLASSGSA